MMPLLPWLASGRPHVPDAGSEQYAECLAYLVPLSWLPALHGRKLPRSSPSCALHATTGIELGALLYIYIYIYIHDFFFFDMRLLGWLAVLLLLCT